MSRFVKDRWMILAAPVILVAAVALVFGFAAVRSGGVLAGIASLRGDSLYISPVTVDFGVGSPETDHVATVNVTNLTSKPITLLGLRTGCRCVGTSAFPVTIEPREIAEVDVRLTMPIRMGGFAYAMELYSDAVGQISSLILVTGTVK